jgi:hypothetical protein
VQDPNTKLGLQDLRTLTKVGAPLLGYIAPYQTVCNYANYFVTGLGSHLSEATKNGTAERVLVKLDNNRQNDSEPGTFAARPVDIPSNHRSQGAQTKDGAKLVKLVGQSYTAAIDAQGNANCSKGQFGYPEGPLTDVKGRYPAAPGNPDPDGSYNTWQGKAGGGSHEIVANYPPFSYGPNYVGIKEGLRNLSDVDRVLKRDGIDGGIDGTNR